MLAVGGGRHPLACLERVVTEAHHIYQGQGELPTQGDIGCNELLDGFRAGARFRPRNEEFGVRRVEGRNGCRISRVIGLLPGLNRLLDLGTKVSSSGLRERRERLREGQRK